MNENELLVHAIINQFKSDLNGNDYTAIDSFLSDVVKDEELKSHAISFLSDDERERLLEGKTKLNW